MHTGIVLHKKIEKFSVPGITQLILALQMMDISDFEVRRLKRLKKTEKNIEGVSQVLV